MAVIAGVLRLDGAPSAGSDLGGVLGQLTHRAPDGARVFDDGLCALGHGASLTTPESAFERQPILLGERWVLAVDGRIDNRAALAQTLGLDAVTLEHAGDADLFALAWRRWDAEFWRHVVGDYALAAWDRVGRKLLLLRDRVGVRPLFFARSRQLLAFASEPEALLGLDGVSRTCDGDGLAYLLADNFGFEDQERTFYRDVRRLRPGWRLEADADGSVRTACDWRPQPQAVALRDPQAWVDEFVEIFDEAVRCRLRTRERPALLLSGGIDSGCVLAAARRLQPADGTLPLRPVSLVETVAPVSSETDNILRLHAGTEGVQIAIETLSSQPLFPALLEEAWNAAHPIDNSLLYARLSCLVARAAGCRVVMDGADGDVVMTSSDSRAGALAASGHLLLALREARLASRFNTYLQGVSPARILLRGFAATVQPDWLARWRYRRRDRREGEAGAGPWVDAGFAKRLQLRERRLATALAARQRRAGASRQEELAWTWWNPGFQRALEGTDRTYARFGLEAWHPWCDQRVVDFFWRLPEEFLARDGWTKWIARTAYAPELGADIAWYSGKSHVGQLLAPQVLRGAAPRISALLASAQELLAGVVDADMLGRLRKDWEAEPARVLETRADDLMNLATLAGWIARYRLQVV